MKTIILIILIFMFCLVYSYVGFSQTSIIQDARGETSLSCGSNGLLAINAKDESISVSYGMPLSKKKSGPNAPPIMNPKYFGFKFKAKGKNGVANILKNDEFQYEGNIGVFYFIDYGNAEEIKNINIMQSYVGLDVLISRFKLYNSSLSYNDQIYNNSKVGFKLSTGFNYSCGITNSIPLIFGIELNGGNKNNSDEINQADIYNIFTVTDPVTLQTRIIQRDKSSAYMINDYRSDIVFGNINTDIGTHIFKRFLILFHSNISMHNYISPKWNPGLGFYITKIGAPLEVVTGLQVQVLDFFDTANSTKPINNRVVVNIVAGFGF